MVVLLVASLSSMTNAASQAELSTALNTSALQPEKRAAAAVVVLDIAEGFHAQSHTPSKPEYIKFDVKMTPNPAVEFGEPVFPPGEDHTYAALGELNVYTGRVIVYVPLTVKADAPPGPITLKGQAI
jgi:hypothetical protein